MTTPMPAPDARREKAQQRDARVRDIELNRRVRELDLYLGLLADALRARGARPHRLRELVGEVRAHCLATGESPVEVFGPPEEYASARFRSLGPVHVVGRMIVAAVGALGVGVVGIALGGRAAGRGTVAVTMADLPLVVWMVVVLVVLPWVVYAVERTVLKGRLIRSDGRRGSWLVHAAVGAMLVATVALIPVFPSGDEGERVVAAAPWWLLALGGGVLTPLVLLARGPERRAVPGPVTTTTGPWWRRVVDWLAGRENRRRGP